MILFYLFILLSRNIFKPKFGHPVFPPCLLHFQIKTLNSTVALSLSSLTILSMPPLQKRNRTEIDNPQPAITMNNHQHKISEYELSREERIRENRERMGKLGILDISLSLKLKPNPPSRRTPSKNPKSPISLNPSGPSRRSSRFFRFCPKNSIFHMFS